jgi:hypothetical protein
VCQNKKNKYSEHLKISANDEYLINCSKNGTRYPSKIKKRNRKKFMKKIVIIAEANAISSGKFSTSCKKNVIPTLSKKQKKEATKYLKLLWFRLIGL